MEGIYFVYIGETIVETDWVWSDDINSDLYGEEFEVEYAYTEYCVEHITANGVEYFGNYHEHNLRDGRPYSRIAFSLEDALKGINVGSYIHI